MSEMKVLSTITLDFVRPQTVIVNAMQGDRRSRYIKINLTAAGSPWTPPNNARPMLRYMKPNSHGGLYDTLEDNTTNAILIVDNTAEICLVEQCLNVPGDVKFELCFYIGDEYRRSYEKLSTFSFILKVAPAAITDETIVQSEEYYNTLTADIAEVIGLIDTAQGDYNRYLASLRSYVGAPRTISTVNEFANADTSLIYVYVGTTGSGYTKGHWYYWNDTQWADGGVYQSDGVVTVDDTLLSPGVPADAKAAGALILVSDTQPIDSTNKIWFPETDPEVTQVPTWTEHQAVVADVVELQEMISDVPIYGMSVIKDLVSTSITLSATTETRYIYGELSSLTITSLPSQGFVNIFFRSGSTPTVLTLPQTVIMPSWFVVGSNETIMISIADGVYGSAQTWES